MFFHTWLNLYFPPYCSDIFALLGHHSNSQEDLTSMAGFSSSALEREDKKATTPEANYLSFAGFPSFSPHEEGLNEGFPQSLDHMVIMHNGLYGF